MRLAETEHRVMNLIWEKEGITARELAEALGEIIGWSKTTTYTVITRCIEKGYIRREDPKFHCYSTISRQQVGEWETDELVCRNYNNRADLLVASLLSRKKLSAEQLTGLYELLNQMESND